MNRSLRIVIAALVAIAIGAGAFSAGVVFGSVRPVVDPASAIATLAAGTAPKDPVVRAVEETQRIIDKKALKRSSEASLSAGAIKGMVESLDDKYAVYFDPKHFEYFNEQTTGEFYGIGVTISDKDGKVFIVSTIKGTPAEKAGIKAEDVIVSVDGITRDPWTTEEIVKRVRGAEGTKVKLTLSRKGEAKPLAFTIKRAKITYPNVVTEMVGKDVGYIRVGQFNGHTTEDLKNAIDELGTKGAKGYLLDLRENPGGLLDQATGVVSLFVQEGEVVRIDSRTGPEDVLSVNGNVATNAPLVVLVDENSASASEIVAAALQDHARATVVGVTTFGKGSVQTIEDLSFGGAIKLTTAHYLSPKKRVIDGKGVKPDVVVKMKPENQMPRSSDTQFKKALETLRSKF